MTDSNIHQQVLARAIKDAAFRQELLSNPKAVLAREFNVQMAENMTIRVLEDTSTTFTLVLPPQETATLELSDMDLEAVAGGVPGPTYNGCNNNTKSCRINC
ncbi:MAG TPA: NHLP leader peptide family RiPP precursor [Ktedonobacterales bacterium]|jgi:hypothetical protein